jgi:hypothetical protein
MELFQQFSLNNLLWNLNCFISYLWQSDLFWKIVVAGMIFVFVLRKFLLEDRYSH